MVRLNEILKETARSRLADDGVRGVGPAADDEDGVRNNLRQQLALAIHVSSVTVNTRSSLFHQLNSHLCVFFCTFTVV